MEHLDMQTLDGNKLNVDALYRICPSAFTEFKEADGTLSMKVDFDKLRAILGDNAISDAPEVYDFTWVGKRISQKEAASRINKTLRPCPDESVEWQSTKNIYIEGDNLEVLKLLQNSYMGKIKTIFIDPPYNTGSDFVYRDNFQLTDKEYDEASGAINEEGKRFISNLKSNGRFHSKWCSMIYSRLLVAKSLLTNDGAIFITIDDNELFNLKSICDEIFGSNNYINTITLKTKTSAGASGGGEDKRLKKNCEYVLIYAKDYSELHTFEGVYEYREMYEVMQEYESSGKSWHYSSILVNPGEKELIGRTSDSEGNDISIYRRNGIRTATIKQLVKEEHLSEKEILYKYSGYIFEPKDAQSSIRTRVIEAKREYGITDDIVSIEYIPRSGRNKGKVYEQFYKGDSCRLFAWLRDISDTIDGVLYKKETQGSFWDMTQELNNLSKEGIVIFHNGKKPVALIKRFIEMMGDKNSIVLDFFSGSATTAHSTLLYNYENDANCKYIMVQIPESVEMDDEEYEDGFTNICEIGKERIRRAGKAIKDENPIGTQNLDTGFRVFKCDESNMKDVYFSPAQYEQGMLTGLEDNIKEDRTDLDLLFDCMLRWGVELSLPVSSTTVDDCTIHNVNDGDLVACFTGTVTESTIEAISNMNPLRVVFRDKSFTEASNKMNLFELFKQKCNWTDEEVKNNVKVI